MNHATWFRAKTRLRGMAVSTYSNRSAAQGASWRRRPTISHSWSRASASRSVLAALAQSLCPDEPAVWGEVIYFRQRRPVRLLSDLNAYDPPQAMRFTAEEITQLQAILKRRFGLDYSAEQAQDAGRAILRFYGYKLLRELQQQRPSETRPQASAGRGRFTKQSL